MKHNAYDVVVIGGGASGMMAAISAARSGASVLIVEKNKRLGEKLRITGGGRCNIWNEEHDERLLLANYGKAEKFLYSSFSRFGLFDTKAFFSELGIETNVEDRKRAFPVTESAEDVAEALCKEIKRLNIDVVYSTEIKKVVASKDTIYEVRSENEVFKAKTYILATGGSSKPETGSTGEGFAWMQELGLKTSDPSPTITPLAAKEQWVKGLSGTTLQNVAIAFSIDSKQSFRVSGDILCTHFGISGPLILNNAAKVADLLQSGEVTARIDLLPNDDHKQLDTKLIQLLEDNRSKQLKSVLKLFLPNGIAKSLSQLFENEIDLEIHASEVTKETRKTIVHTSKALPLTISHLMGFDKAVIADGGLELSELDMRSMRTNRYDNLYITGDLLNINRPSGGYSLQLCWTSGYIAGSSAASSLNS